MPDAAPAISARQLRELFQDLVDRLALESGPRLNTHDQQAIHFRQPVESAVGLVALWNRSRTHNTQFTSVRLSGRAFPARVSSVLHQVVSPAEIVRSGLPDLVLVLLKSLFRIPNKRAVSISVTEVLCLRLA